MEATFNKIKEIAERSRLELLGYLHQAAEELKEEARDKGIFVKHSFDFTQDSSVHFWISVMDNGYKDLFHDFVNFGNIDQILNVLKQANNIIANYNKEGE